MTNTSNNTSNINLTRQQLELINRRTIRYPLQIAEKDYFLAIAIELIHNPYSKITSFLRVEQHCIIAT
jgi:hypothetical protein